MNSLGRSAWFHRVVAAEKSGPAGAGGLLLLRVATGLLIFYVHGWHKLEGGIAYLRHGTPWQLAEEIAAMRVPWPLAAAFAATAVQFVCAPLLVVGWFTRVNAAVLAGVLGGAIVQNLLAGRDPQLALLYTIVVAALAVTGGGPFSLDARLFGGGERP
ncbi:MAG: DoxX family protein [Verrucomicrobia bacterium]|nr:DoxX family protein [Verrucomicrobiota bacterium]